MEKYLFIKECLFKFNYPNIHGLDDMRIADIFSNANRQFLVCWSLKQIDADYAEIVENATKEDLAEILYCNGFCANSVKMQFMNGECDSDTQWNTLNKIFKHIESLSHTKDHKQKQFLSDEDLKDLLDFDKNLFPMYGPRQMLTSPERKNKIEKYREEIEHLKSLLIDSEATSEPKTPLPLDANLNDKLLRGLENLERSLPDFRRGALDIMKDKREKQTEKIQFEENSAQTLKACEDNAEITLNFIKNMKLITSFKENNFGTVDSDRNNRNGVIMREMHGLCNDVVSSSK